MMQFAAMRCSGGGGGSGGVDSAAVTQVQEAAATLIGCGGKAGHLTAQEFTAALLSSSLPLLVEIRDIFHLDSGACLGLAL